jgi:hypothetical protein
MALRGDDDFNENKGANNGAVSGTQNGTEKVQKEVRVSHAPASRALRDEIMRNNNNNINNKGNIGGLGDQAPNENQMQKPCKNEKTGNNNPEHKNKPSKRVEIGGGTTAPPDAQKPVSSHENGHRDNFEGTVPTIDGRPIVDVEDEGPIFSEFWEAYDKRVNIDGARAVWDVLSVADHEAIMAYIPQYKRAQPNKKFRYNPLTFLTKRAWKDELIQENEPINNKGYEGSTSNQRGSASSPRGNQRQDNDDMRDQTVRIVQRLRANRQADKSDEPDPGGGEG